MSDKMTFSRLVAGLDFIGPDLTFAPKENTIGYGYQAATTLLVEVAKAIAEKRIPKDAVERLVRECREFSNSIDERTLAGQGFLSCVSIFSEDLKGRNAA